MQEKESDIKKSNSIIVSMIKLNEIISKIYSNEFLSIEFEVFLTEKVMEKWNKCERTRLNRIQH